ncbi:hypothetical protein Dsin_002407 [Dipteronia sinensis]|uniref:xylose isomerase n=1 Tax=Dipteronia sinensis TaxID=43782 RepID=A0AAE0EJD5_9ROSI|nr:hypothetical protein Dsin_002407 [Dipteronia sinensis]
MTILKGIWLAMSSGLLPATLECDALTVVNMISSKAAPCADVGVGPTSKNPLSFKWYNAQEEILGKKMKDWMRFSMAFWHTFRGSGADPFGSATKNWPWEDGTNSLAMAKKIGHGKMVQIQSFY